MNNPLDAEIVAQAREFCRACHAGQFRDDGADYATHPEAVAQILAEAGVDDPAILCVAYLHDVLEDTDTPEDAIAQRFGADVLSLVTELTNIGPAGRTFEEKHQAIAEEARHMSSRAKWVKFADRLHNLSQMACWDDARQNRYARVTRELLDALRPWPAGAEKLAERIEAVIQPFPR